jgi:hypothetical protein
MEKKLQYPFDPGVTIGVGRFVIQDPDCRRRILPLFDFSSERPEERVQGQGTVFRLDPFGTCATAFHVFEEAFYLGGASGRELLVRKDRAIVALELEGIAFGTAPIQPHQWRTMNRAYSIIRVDEPPFEMPRMRNFTELLALDVSPSSAKPGGVEFFHADAVGWRPTLGETVLGIGYPSLDKEEGGSDDRPTVPCIASKKRFFGRKSKRRDSS